MSGSHLAIQSQNGKIRFDLFRNGSLGQQSSLSLTGNEREDKDALDEFFKTNAAFMDAEDVSLSWYSEKSTLVPNLVFNESSPLEIFELCYGKDKNSHEVDFNRLPELGLIHVFEFPTWLKRYFVIKFSRVIVQHEGTHILRKVMQSAFKPKALIVIHAESFLLTIVKHNNLEFYSHFSYQGPEDIIYYLTYTLQQKEIDINEGSIDVADLSENKMFEQLKGHVSKIAELKNAKLSQQDSFVAEAHLLCV